MNQIFRNIISFFAAIYFLLAGTGYNLINYCCDSCKNEGIEFIAIHSCEAVHQQNSSNNFNTENHEDFTYSDFINHQSCCHILRLNTDTPSIQTSQIIFSQPIVYTNLIFIPVSLMVEIKGFTYKNYIQPPNGYSFLTGRDIITYHAVFLI